MTHPTRPLNAFLSLVLPLVSALTAGCGDVPTAPADEAKRYALGMPHETEPVEPPSNPIVAGELIIRLAYGVSIDQVHAQFGTSTVGEIPQAWTYLVATPPGVPLDELAASMTSSLCDEAEFNYPLETPESEQQSLAIYEGDFDHTDYVDQEAFARIRAAEAHAISTGSGVLVAVIDTGIDLDHPDLADNLGPPGYDFIDEDAEPADLPNGVDDDGNSLVDEATGHGSHVAGIVAAAAPGVVLLPLRVLDSDGTGTVFNVTRAIYYAIDAGAQVINLSLGLDERVDAMKRAIQDARDADVMVVASAGNRGMEDESHFPARLSEVVAVAATNAFDLKAAFSSFGSHIAVSAPGEGIMSTYWNGGYAIWSGTSMAAPIVAAAGALRLAVEPLDPGHLQQVIEDTSADLPPNPYENGLGEGRVDLLGVAESEPSGGPGGGGGGRPTVGAAALLPPMAINARASASSTSCDLQQ